jgi:hypothetical protein
MGLRRRAEDQGPGYAVFQTEGGKVGSRPFSFHAKIVKVSEVSRRRFGETLREYMCVDIEVFYRFHIDLPVFK